MRDTFRWIFRAAGHAHFFCFVLEVLPSKAESRNVSHCNLAATDRRFTPRLGDFVDASISRKMVSTANPAGFGKRSVSLADGSLDRSVPNWTAYIMRLLSHFALLAFTVFPVALQAEISLPSVISGGMVIQRGRPVPIFGVAGPGEVVSVTFRGVTVRATADKSGDWSATLPTQHPGGPFEMVVAGTNTITLEDVYCGDVWLCSGQSNMAEPVSKVPAAEEVRTHESLLPLRLFQANRNGGWTAASRSTANAFSAVGYFFGRDLYQSQQVPIGLISAASGGSSAEQWVDPAVLQTIGITDSGQGRGRWGGLYSQMIKPLVPFTIRGVIWYQGESNTGRYVQYQQVMTALIASWREEWGQGEFPFYYVQLARQSKGGDRSPHFDEGWPSLRDAQRRTLVVPNTGMAVSFDVRDGNTHPPDKKAIALRLSRIARAREYNEPIECSGPLFASIQRRNGQIILHFEHADGLRSRGDHLNGFEIGDAESGFRSIEATIVEETVVIQSDANATGDRSEIRYAWGRFPRGNLYNAAGLPASPFSTAAKLTESAAWIARREVQARVTVVTQATTPAEVRAAVQAVNDYVAENQIRRRQLTEFARLLVGSRPFAKGRYGIPAAREVLTNWAKFESR